MYVYMNLIKGFKQLIESFDEEKRAGETFSFNVDNWSGSKGIVHPARLNLEIQKGNAEKYVSSKIKENLICWMEVNTGALDYLRVKAKKLEFIKERVKYGFICLKDYATYFPNVDAFQAVVHRWDSLNEEMKTIRNMDEARETLKNHVANFSYLKEYVDQRIEKNIPFDQLTEGFRDLDIVDIDPRFFKDVAEEMQPHKEEDIKKRLEGMKFVKNGPFVKL